MQKSWMWPNNKSGVEGAYIDLDTGTVQWFDEPGCACAGSNSEQSIEEFMAKGPRFIIPPDDVLEEMKLMIRSGK